MKIMEQKNSQTQFWRKNLRRWDYCVHVVNRKTFHEGKLDSWRLLDYFKTAVNLNSRRQLPKELSTVENQAGADTVY